MQIDIRNLYKTYPGGVTALQDVTLDISIGMFWAAGSKRGRQKYPDEGSSNP